MKRYWWLSAIGAVGAIVFVQLTRSDAALAPAPPGERSELAEAQPQPAVQVEHVLVQAELVTSPEPPPALTAVPVSHGRSHASKATARPMSTRAASFRPAPAETGTPPPLLERARRAFLGDGRHRPEPFPRLKDN